MKLQSDIVLQVIENGIYYYNKFGEIGAFHHPEVDYERIKSQIGKKIFSFKWKDLNVKFWLTKEEAETKAQEYLNSINKYIDLELLKKICELKEDDTFYYKENDIIYDERIESFSHYDKQKLAFVRIVEYDNDYICGYDEYEHPISEYGKTWALTREELENGSQ